MQLGVPNETIPTCSEAPFLIIVSGPPKLILIKFIYFYNHIFFKQLPESPLHPDLPS